VAVTDFRLGEFAVQPSADRLISLRDSVRIDLEPKSMAVLVMLAEHAGEVVSSDALIRSVWRNRPMGENPVYKSIAKLRRALGDETGEPRYIETIPRKGYRLIAPPEPVTSAAPSVSTCEPDRHDPHDSRPVRTMPVERSTRLSRRAYHPLLAGVIALAVAGGAALSLHWSVDSPAANQVSVPSETITVAIVDKGADHEDQALAGLIDDAISERLGHAPGIELTTAADDTGLASLRLTIAVTKLADGQAAVRLDLEGPLGSGLWTREVVATSSLIHEVVDAAVAAVLEARHVLTGAQQAHVIPRGVMKAYREARADPREGRSGRATRGASDAIRLVELALQLAPVLSTAR
jgi:DNA-binding winged helix-turn-helix (wHTH) protein